MRVLSIFIMLLFPSLVWSQITFDKKEIESMIKDFYLTDSISRLSKTMAECSQIRKELRNGKAI